MNMSAAPQFQPIQSPSGGPRLFDVAPDAPATDPAVELVLKDSLIQICEQLNALTRGLSGEGPTTEGKDTPPSTAACATFARIIVANYRERAQFFPPDLFVDPAWNLTLDLYISRVEDKKISVSSALIATGIPSTTALRLLERLVDLRFVVKTPDDIDRRRIYVSLSEAAFGAVTRHLGGAIGRTGKLPLLRTDSAPVC
jgi:hypothetical protein